ncbi:MAG: ABC transporter permease [Chloroflexi bacterium]|nr:ABC transporter permease [Chloroflexota bacterium]MBL7200339.1 ABC transporter permease [Anaerolineae bacterium]
MAWQRFRRHKMALLGAGLLLSIVLYVTLGAFILSEEYANHNDLKARLQPPSTAHLFGTDGTGRDIVARTVYGGQISIIIGFLAVLVSVTVGVLVGAVAGYYGGIVDSVLMRLTETVFNIPQLFLLILLGKMFSGKIKTFQFLGRSFSGSVVVIIGVIGFTSWMFLARIVRASYLALREREFIVAAQCLGTPDRFVIFRHILPNTIAPIVVSATLGVAGAILSEAYISFLGMGVQAPTATWGNMLDQAYHHLETEPWMWFFPGILIVLTVLAINFLGDGMRDALDPRTVR